MRSSRVLNVGVAMAVMALAAVTLAGPASAEPKPPPFHSEHGHRSRAAVCTGTFDSPGVLVGTYRSNVVVDGVCFVNGGAATILGDLTISPGSALAAIFALDDVAGNGASSLTVRGDVQVQKGGIAFLGCEPNFSPCMDDPNANTGGTLSSQVHISGDLREFQPLTVVVHASTINGDVTEIGGGGGVNCDLPPGVLTAIGSPAYSDYEDNTIGGNLVVFGLKTCWLGSLRNVVRGSLIDVFNTMADPDAGEVLQNTIHQNVVCFGNSPSVQYGDSGASPNVVGGRAFGECGFNVMSPDPNYGSGGPQPISVKAS